MHWGAASLKSVATCVAYLVTVTFWMVHAPNARLHTFWPVAIAAPHSNAMRTAILKTLLVTA